MMVDIPYNPNYVPSGANNRINEYYKKMNHVKIARNTRNRREFLGSSDPSSLFANGEPGVFYNMRDMSTLFQDSAGTIPVTDYGDPVGLRLDQSQGGVGDSIDYAPADASTGTGTSDYSGGVITLTGTTSVDRGKVSQDIAVDGVNTIEVTFTLTSATGALLMGLGTTEGSNPSTHNSSALGTFTYILPLAPPNTFLNFGNGSGGGTVTVENISVREIPGVHQHQPTETARPIYTRHPKSGVRQLIDDSGDMTIWAGNGDVVVTPGQPDPNGGNTAFRITGDSWISLVKDVAEAHDTFSIMVKSAGTGADSFDLMVHDGAGGSTFVATDEWVTHGYVYVDGTGNTGLFRTPLSDPIDIYVWHPQAETGGVVTDYQSRVSQYDVTESGVPDCFGLTYDGVDDYMVTTGDLDMTSTDKETAMVGLRVTNYDTSGVPMGHHTTANNVGGFDLRAPKGSGTIPWGARVVHGGGTAHLTGTEPTDNPSYGVQTLVIDFNGGGTGSASYTYNDVDSQSGSLTGVATCPSYLLYSGVDRAVANLLAGTVYSDLLIGRLLTPEELAETKQWFAEGTPVVTL